MCLLLHAISNRSSFENCQHQNNCINKTDVRACHVDYETGLIINMTARYSEFTNTSSIIQLSNEMPFNAMCCPIKEFGMPPKVTFSGIWKQLKQFWQCAIPDDNSG